MRKRITSALLTLVMLLTLVPALDTPARAEGNTTGYGTVTNPYVVRDYDGLKNILEGTGSAGLTVTYVELGADFSTTSRNGGFGIAAGETIHINGCVDLNLNGKTATLYTKGSLNSFIDVQGILKIRNTGMIGTGKLYGRVDNTGKPKLITVSDGGFLTVESGEVELYSYIGNSMTAIQVQSGGKAIFDNGTISYRAFDDSIYGEERNGGLKYQDYALKMDLGSTVTINGGTFNGRVLCNTERVASADEPKQLTINGGSFSRSIYFNFETYDRNKSNIPVVINGGTFSWNVDGVVDGRSIPSSNEKGYDTMRLFQFVGDSDIFSNDPDHIVEKAFAPGALIHAESNARLREVMGAEAGDKWIAVTESNSEDVFTQLKPYINPGYGSSKYCLYSPITVIPNAYGIKDVILNGAPIQYTHNSPYAPVYDVKRSEANTLTFSWYDLPEEMKAAGYSYSYSYQLFKNNVKTVIGGTVTPTTAGGVSTWTHTVPADSAMNSYVVYLRLDLMKDGVLVNTVSYDDYIVRLRGTDSIVSLTETTLSLPNGDLRPDHYYGTPRESNPASVSGGVKYSISSQTDWAGTLGDDYHFKAGNEYTKTVTLKANTGYQFTASCAAALTGAPSAKITSAVVSADQKFMTVQLQATCVTVVRTASGTLTGFYQGMDVWDAKVISAEPEKYDIEIAYIKAKDTAGDYWEHSVFEASGVYIFGLKVVPKPGYGFLETAYGTVNLTVNVNEEYGYTSRTLTGKYTKDPSFGNYSSGYIGVFFQTEPDDKCFPPPQTFDRVNVSIKVPVAGDSADEIAYKKAFVDQPGFTVTEFYWEEKGASGRFTGTFEAGKEYLYNIRVEWQKYMKPVMDSKNDPKYTLYINGETTNDWPEYDANRNVVAISGCYWMTATGTAPGVSIIGTVTSWNDKDDAEYYLYPADTEDTTIRAQWKVDGMVSGYLYEGEGEAISKVTVNGKDMQSQPFHFDAVPEGEYKLVIFKPEKYVPKIVPITVGSTADYSCGELKLWLYGDVNYDGAVNAADATQILRRFNSKDPNVFSNGSTQDKADRLLAANVNGDSNINIADSTQILRYFNGKYPNVLNNLK